LHKYGLPLFRLFTQVRLSSKQRLQVVNLISSFAGCEVRAGFGSAVAAFINNTEPPQCGQVPEFIMFTVSRSLPSVQGHPSGRIDAARNKEA
jgi:hypothetical protein